MFKKTTVIGSLNALNGKDPFSKKWLHRLLLILIALGIGGYFIVKKYYNKKDD